MTLPAASSPTESVAAPNGSPKPLTIGRAISYARRGAVPAGRVAEAIALIEKEVDLLRRRGASGWGTNSAGAKLAAVPQIAELQRLIEKLRAQVGAA